MTKEDFKKIILYKLDEINEEYDVIMKDSDKHSLTYINTVTSQRNSMRQVLEELLNEVEIWN